jgi:glycosyltransferase 2 family protein
MKLPRNLTTRSFAVIGFSVVLYVVFAIYFGWENINLELKKFPPLSLLLLGGLSLVNYLLRYLRWEIYLKSLKCSLPRRHSFSLYFATYVMVITPGKIGEVFKAGILKERFGVPLSRGIPIILAERIYDFFAVLILAVAGIFFWPGTLTGMKTGLLAAAAIPVLLIIFQQPRVRTFLVSKAAKSPLLGKYSLGLEDSMNSLGILLSPGQTFFSIILSTVAWLCECLGLWLVCSGLGLAIPMGQAVFVYAAGTLVGSLSFLPGGLGGTEATIIWLLGVLDITGATAAAVALLVRLFTLWLAVFIGMLFFLFARKDLLKDQ